MATQFILHRVNAIAEQSRLDPAWGAEIDLRSAVDAPGSVHLSHDPWARGDDFAEWVPGFARRGCSGPLILNTKEDGLERRALELVQEAGLKSYFFLDTTVPTLVQWCLRQGVKDFAVRISKHEGLESVKPFRNAARWAWLDCFDGDPLSLETALALKEDFKLCLVSPELQKIPLPGKLEQFLPLARLCDAVCTKDPAAWMAGGLR